MAMIPSMGRKGTRMVNPQSQSYLDCSAWRFFQAAFSSSVAVAHQASNRRQARLISASRSRFRLVQPTMAASSLRKTEDSNPTPLRASPASNGASRHREFVFQGANKRSAEDSNLSP